MSTPDSPLPTPSRKRFRFRYTLRALLVFITLFGLWGGYHANRGWKERKAQEILSHYHASFMYGPTRRGKGIWNEAQYVYERVVQLVWQERFITYVSIYSPLEPEVVEALANLPHLKRLLSTPSRLSDHEKAALYGQGKSIAKHKVPNGALRDILASHSFTGLGLGVWVLSDDDCRVVADHATLEWLSVDASQVSEEGFASLLAGPSLRQFSARCCEVTGDKLATAKGSNSLEYIECDGSPVGVEFARFIAKSTNVANLVIAHQTVNDEFVAQIADHPSLSQIHLGGTAVTDQCIYDLSALEIAYSGVFADSASI